MNEKAQRMAAAYARATTNTRCAHMGQCGKCTVRYCDYRSRVDSYLQGYAQAYKQLSTLEP